MPNTIIPSAVETLFNGGCADRASVSACSEAFYKEFDEALSCIRIVAKGTGAKPQTCIQCGKCMRTCKHEAITQNPKTGVYMINKKKCVGCGECVEACPMHVMVLKPENPASKCIACGICVTEPIALVPESVTL